MESDLSIDTLDLYSHNTKNNEKHKRQKTKRKKCLHKKKTTNSKLVTKNVISQEIHVQQQDSKCIINLKTTVCNNIKQKTEICNNIEHKTDTEEKPQSFPNLDSRVREKIVIKCFRESCDGSKSLNVNKNVIKEESLPRHHHLGRKCMDKHSSHRHNVNRYNRYANKLDPKQLFSPISSASLKAESGNLTYEEISEDSLENYNVIKQSKLKRKVKQKKKHCQHCTHCRHGKKEKKESKLDTLIRRTKERERKLVEKSRRRCITPHLRLLNNTKNDQLNYLKNAALNCKNEDKLKYTKEENFDNKKDYDAQSNAWCSTLKDADENTEYTSDMDISFVSRSTLVLDKGNLPYSPSDPFENKYEGEKFHRTFDTPLQDYLFKTEPTMDIGAYSPIQTPDHFEIVVKKEIKTEPMSSPNINNNYLSEYVKDFQVPNIKTEIEKN